MTPAQLQTLKTAIANETDAAFVQLRNAGATGAMAEFFNQPAVPDYWVWRTNVARADIYHTVSPDGTSWNWTTYKNQSQTEQGAWVQMFMGDLANFALPNLRAGVAAIFTGSAQANAQREHCLAIGRRLAKRGERLFATGTGSTASPATMAFEGNVTNDDVVGALSA